MDKHDVKFAEDLKKSAKLWLFWAAVSFSLLLLFQQTIPGVTASASELLRSGIIGLSSASVVVLCGILVVMGCLIRVMLGLIPPAGRFFQNGLDIFIESESGLAAACFGVYVGSSVFMNSSMGGIAEAAATLLFTVCLLVVKGLMRVLYDADFEYPVLVQTVLSLGSAFALFSLVLDVLPLLDVLLP